MNAVAVRRMIGVLLVLVIAALGVLGYAFYAMQTASANLKKAEEERIRALQLVAETQQTTVKHIIRLTKISYC